MRSLLLTLSTGLLLATPADTPADTADRYEASCAPTIMNSILELESARDAKCYATATRVENFMFGIPLEPETQVRKTELQKMMVHKVWQEAGTAANGQTISTAILNPILETRLNPKTDDTGSVHLDTKTFGRLSLTEVDLSHYGGIAYALRAILSVQQDDLFTPEPSLANLDEEAIESLKQFLDLYTLFSLKLATEHALKKGDATLSPDDLETGWKNIAALQGS